MSSSKINSIFLLQNSETSALITPALAYSLLPGGNKRGKEHLHITDIAVICFLLSPSGIQRVLLICGNKKQKRKY